MATLAATPQTLPDLTRVDSLQKKGTARRFTINFSSHKVSSNKLDVATTVDAEVTTERGKSQTSKLKLFVHMLKDGPANNSSDEETDVDESVDAPMPRRKTKYERFLKHQVREAQVKKYNEMIEKESADSKKEQPKSGFMRIRRNRSGEKLVDITPSKKVRFIDDHDNE